MTVDILFYLFSALTIGGAILVITSRNPVRAVVSLIFTFIFAACIWLLLEVSFLALVLIVVYVGAVMVLFMFVVMMIDIEDNDLKSAMVQYWPIAIIMGALFLMFLVWVIHHGHFGLNYYPTPKSYPADYSTVKVLGKAIYSKHLYSFLIAGMILLISMISAIALTFRGRRPGTKNQKPSEQIQTSPEDRLKMIQMDSVSKSKSNSKINSKTKGSKK